MLHPFLNPNTSSLPKRALHRVTPPGGGSGSGTGDARVESIANLPNLPAVGSAEEARLRLAALEGQISQEEAQRQLLGLKTGMELQEQAQRQEAQEVNYVLNKLGTNLENATERKAVLDSIQNRMTLQLAVLAEDNEITEAQLAPGNIEATLTRLAQNKGSIKVKKASGERNLYAHEQSVLTIPGLLKNHSNEEVKKAWEQMSQSMRQNVRLMRAASRLAGGQSPSQSMTGRMSAGVKNAWEGVVDRWKNGSTMDKAMIVGAGVAAVGLLFMLGKKLFGKESSGSRGGALFGILGVGAALAGGVYLYNRFMNPLQAFNRLRDMIPGMSREQFATGLRAHLAGNETAARAAWGEHYDTLSASMGRRPTGAPSNGESQSETDENGVEWVPPRDALRNYMEDTGELILPVTSWLKEHAVEMTLIGSYLFIRNFDAIKGGLNNTKESMLGFARLLGNHPVKSVLALSAFFAGLAYADRNFKLPKNGAAMKRLISQKRRELASFMHTEGLGTLPQEHLDAAADVLAGDESITKYEDEMKEVAGEAVTKLTERLRLTPAEKIRQENIRGMVSFIDQIKLRRKHRTPEGAALVTRAENLKRKIQLEGNIDSTDLSNLETAAEGINIYFLREDNYVYWGEKNSSGKWVDPAGNEIEADDLRCLAVDPSKDQDVQFDAANHFSPNPDSLSSALLGGFVRRPSEQIRNSAASIVEGYREGLVNGTVNLVFIEGGTYILDGVSKKYIEAPIELLKMIGSSVTDGELNAKEFLFTYGEGMIPVMVLGAGSSLANFRLPFRGGVKNALIETLAYPFTGTADSWRLSKTRIMKPFGEGFSRGSGVVGRMRAGLESVYELNRGRLIERGHLFTGRLRALKAIMKSERMVELIRAQDALRESLSFLRRAEGASSILHTSRIDAAKEIIQSSKSKNIRFIAELLDAGNLDGSTKTVVDAIKYFEDLEKGMSSVQELKAGRTIAASQLENLRILARNDDFAEIFQKTLSQFGAAKNEIESLRNALKGEESLDVLAAAFKRADLVADSLGDLSLIFKAEEPVAILGRSRKALNALVNMIKGTGKMTKNGFIYMWKALGGERSSAAFKRVFEALKNIPGATQSKVMDLVEVCQRSSKFGDVRTTLQSTGLLELDDVARAADESIDLARAAHAAETAIDASTDVARGTGAAIDTAQTVAQTVRGLDGALDAMKNGQRLSYLQLRSLQQAAQGENFVQTLRNAGVAVDHVDEVALLFKEQKELGTLVRGLEGTGALKIGNGVKGILKIARFAGPAMATAGLVAGGLEAWQAWGMAEEYKNNPELRDIYNNRGNMNMAAALASFTVDVAMMAGRLGSLAAIPLTIIIENIRYVANAAMDASAEIAKSDDDWLKEASQNGFSASGIDAEEWGRLTKEGVVLDEHQMSRLLVLNEMRKGANKQYLLHALVNTTHDTGAGEAYNAIFSWDNTMDTFRDGRQETMSKLLSSIIKIDTGNKPVSYNQYRMKFINAKLASFDNIEKARKAIDGSIIFADIMQNREQTLSYNYEDAPGSRTINLSDSKFDSDKIEIRDIYAVVSSAKQLNENGLKQEIGEKLYERIEGLDKNYLNYAVNAMMLYLSKVMTENLEGGLSDADKKIQNTAEMVRRFLLFNGYQFTRIPTLSDPEAHMEDINKVFFDESTSDEGVQDAMVGYVPRSKGTAAIYVYAVATGYKGSANIGDLEKYFTEGKKDWLGIYYNKDEDLPGGGEWVVNEEGMESDNEAGSNPDVAALKMIEYIREEPDNILTSRFDYITDTGADLREWEFRDREDETRREKWMLEIARRMKRAYDQSSAPANVREWESTSMVDHLASDTVAGYKSLVNDPLTGLKMAAEQANEEIVSTLDSATGGVYSSTVNTVRDGVGSVLSGIGGLFSSDDDDDDD
jgi:hypothetical protein